MNSLWCISNFMSIISSIDMLRWIFFCYPRAFIIYTSILCTKVIVDNCFFSIIFLSHNNITFEIFQFLTFQVLEPLMGFYICYVYILSESIDLLIGPSYLYASFSFEDFALESNIITFQMIHKFIEYNIYELSFQNVNSSWSI